MPQINYNERSWAIDVISEINLYLANKSWHVKSAGGENTIRNEKSSLFPDVLIFKDSAKKIILQGWELKMPDTPITDTELINNAKIKSEILHNNSFILWNVTSAVLYVKKGNTYSILKSWNSIDLHSRSEVKENENLWKDLLHTILEDLNDYFEHGEITESGSSEILAIDKIIDIVLENIDSTAENIKENIKSSAVLDAQIDNWWLSSAAEYGFSSQAPKDAKHKLPTLSKVILTDWFFKIIFGNIIKRHFNEAKIIETITFDTTVSEALQIIANISEHCNFWNIFGNNIANELVSDNAWKQLVQLNVFLSNLNIEGVDIQILQNLLQSSIAYAKRKVAGQFATPPQLADLLTRLTIDKKDGITLDPCCGTGTIIKQAYSLKEEYEIGQEQIIESIWASDKHSFPIQLSTLTLSNPGNIGKVLHIFRSDVIELHAGQTIVFKDPNNGNQVEKQLPKVDYIISNLPFIREKEIKKLNPNINSDLWTVRKIIRLHGGKITGCRHGKAATFQIVIPTDCHCQNQSCPVLKHSSAKTKTQIDDSCESPKSDKQNTKARETSHILLVMADKLFSDYLKKTLSRYFQISVLDNPELLINTAISQNPDAIIIDDNVNGISGDTLSTQIKENKMMGYIPIILLLRTFDSESYLSHLESRADRLELRTESICKLRADIRMLVENRMVLRERIRLFLSDAISPMIPSKAEIETENADRNFMDKVNKILEKNLSTDKYTIDKLSLDIGMSRTAFYNKIKEITGNPPEEYINSFKMDKALKLLASQQYRISDIASILGYCDAKYFGKKFKDFYHVCPSDYIKSIVG